MILKMTNNNLRRISRLALLLLMVTSAAYSQEQLNVSGRILNSSSKAISDVTISFDGNTGAPSVTDSLGIFELLVPDGNVWLSISPIGTYKEKQVYLNKRQELTIYLDKQEIVTLMTLGSHPELLTLGYLRNQGFIDAIEQVECVQVDWEVDAVAVVTRDGVDDLE